MHVCPFFLSSLKMTSKILMCKTRKYYAHSQFSFWMVDIVGGWFVFFLPSCFELFWLDWEMINRSFVGHMYGGKPRSVCETPFSGGKVIHGVLGQGQCQRAVKVDVVCKCMTLYMLICIPKYEPCIMYRSKVTDTFADRKIKQHGRQTYLFR